MPFVARATAASDSSAARTKPGRSSRSSGGYPVTASSGNATMSAPARFASSSRSRISARFPSRSPTIGLIWASASLTAKRVRAPRRPREPHAEPDPDACTDEPEQERRDREARGAPDLGNVAADDRAEAGAEPDHGSAHALGIGLGGRSLEI